MSTIVIQCEYLICASQERFKAELFYMHLVALYFSDVFVCPAAFRSPSVAQHTKKPKYRRHPSSRPVHAVLYTPLE
jgi:hypothetical protein